MRIASVRRFLKTAHVLWFVPAIVAAGIVLVYARYSPGMEYFGAYAQLVENPKALEPVFGIPWTYNPGWLVAVLAPFYAFGGRAGLTLFLLVSVILLMASTWIFKGRQIPMLLSAQLAWILGWGQIEAFVVFGIALGWLAVKRQSWFLMFLAMALATLKPQVGAIAILVLWWWSGKNRWYALGAYAALVAASILIWGPWPFWILEGMFSVVKASQYQAWNASIGLSALPLFFLAFYLPLDRERRLIAITASAMVCSPYMPYYSTIPLLCMAIPWWGYVFALIPYITSITGSTTPLRLVMLLPLGLMGWLYFPYLNGCIRARLGILRRKYGLLLTSH